MKGRYQHQYLVACGFVDGYAARAGHYLTYIDPSTRELTTLAIPGFREELHVFVDAGQLRADHAFWIFGLPFLTLRYRMQRRKAEAG